MSNFDFKKYLAEGRLHEEEQIDPQVDTLQQALGVKVAPARFGKDNYTIYPDSTPDRDRYYDNRTAQSITIKAEDGKYYFSTAGGYDRSIQPIAYHLGADVRDTRTAGYSAVDLSLNKPEVSIDVLKKLVYLMQKGLKDESKAQSDFYKGWSNPD